jgi:flagellar export protein FliJ
MAFHFVFEKLLHLRAGIERQEELRLATIAAQIAKIRTEIAAIERRRTDVRREVLQEVAGGSTGAALQFAVACDAAATELRKKLEMRLRTAEKARAQQLEVYRQARQRREVFERLRDRKLAVHEHEATRRDQESADDMFLIGSSQKRED